MPARVFPALGTDTSFRFRRSFIDLPRDLLLINAKPSSDKTGIVIQVREVAGSNASITWHDVISSWSGLKESTSAESASEVNVLEEKIATVGKRIEFKPFETKFIKVEL
jgi:hypothetical protein